MHFAKSTPLLLFTTLLLALSPSILHPASAATNDTTTHYQTCITCLTTAALTKSPSCSKDPTFSVGNWNPKSTMTEDEKSCLCGLVGGEGDEFWVRGCIAKPPSACSEQEGFTKGFYDALAGFKTTCPAAGAVGGTGGGGSGGVRSVEALSWMTVFLSGVVSIALL